MPFPRGMETPLLFESRGVRPVYGKEGCVKIYSRRPTFYSLLTSELPYQATYRGKVKIQALPTLIVKLY